MTVWRPIETAPMDGTDMLVRCADGTEGFDSLNGRGPAGGADDGPTWEWWHASDSPRTHWTRDPAEMARVLGECVEEKKENAK